MSSPFPIPGSSPFPFALPVPQLTHPSPLASSTAQALHAPSPLTQLLVNASASTPGLAGLPTFPAGTGTGITPGVIGITGTFGASPSYPFPGITPNTSALISASLAAAASTPLPQGQVPLPGPSAPAAGGEMTTAHLISALEQADGLLARLQSIEREVENLQRRVFVPIRDSEKGGASTTPEQRVEVLHVEYTQILISLLSLSQTSLIGALPSALPQDGKVTLPGNAAASSISLPDLSKWAEDQAALQFAGGEAVRAGGKAVMDVLRGGAAR